MCMGNVSSVDGCRTEHKPTRRTTRAGIDHHEQSLPGPNAPVRSGIAPPAACHLLVALFLQDKVNSCNRP